MIDELTYDNYEVVFHIPANLRQDIYIVDKGNFTESFHILYSEYEQVDVDFHITIRPTKVQIFCL